ncbi:MAG: hypothetical protein JW908_06500, partial [Anaerolineales bacterium]|nr:hypothetical protein [Anaerolineales bacterium]
MKKININLKFWLKNLLYYYTPGGYGYYRFLKSHRDSNIKSYRDLYPSDFNGEWKDCENGNYSSRRYDSYQTYISHQASKFHALIKKKGGFSNRTVLDYRLIFYRRFCYLSKYLAKSAKILCAGARQGTEVEVLRDLGFYNATGIDLNPGPSNPLVSYGDFMHLEYENDSLDLIYSNSIDHAFDFE